MSQELDFKLKAKNSNGEHTLYLVGDTREQEFYFTLTGDYKGERIQIDFNPLLRSELEELSLTLQLILEHT